MDTTETKKKKPRGIEKKTSKMGKRRMRIVLIFLYKTNAPDLGKK